MKIVLDVFGGDNSPHAHIEGTILALKEQSSLQVVLVGDEKIITAELLKHKYDSSRIEIVHAPEIITNDDIPTTAIKSKKDSSLVKSFDLCKERDDIAGMITTGNTGAALTGATLKIGRIPGIRRPALAPLIPTVAGNGTCLVDAGANVDCKAEYLGQFALLGSAFMRALYGIENPKVALLSNGTEDKKGNELTHEAFDLLKKLPINFVGNAEAKTVMSGEYDVLVCDGFVGNVLLKTVGGSLVTILKLVKTAMKSTLKSKIGGLFAKKALKKMVHDLTGDVGAAAFLGCKKLVSKAHGSSKAQEIKISLSQMQRMVDANLVAKIEEEMKKLEAAE
ncbi:MAG: phosphate acyltransferase PlsX [Firmicutes bacterium]|nr:phosphate acyltransferase PlsX [Bacillota bacterium]